MSSSLLSSYPSDKIVVACKKCGMRKQFDKAAMLRAGGDRPLTLLLDEVARRSGCTLVDRPSVDIYDRCEANYPERVKLLKAAGKW